MRLLEATDYSDVKRGVKRRCGAKTRKGTTCRAKPLPGKTRCKFHGGMSTGPRTPEGRERIAEAQRRRWCNLRDCGEE
ncbi:HGGxSTG domain-containing protein [Aquicoccus sp.]|uniref:HGGxSTG domain-containing protein n=1 Tax=Aquicoccus sp. TaxID=2055851 RepID=UPI003569C082